jgi:hypothetical protein
MLRRLCFLGSVIAFSTLVCACSGGNPGAAGVTPPAGNVGAMSTTPHFRAATAAERSQERPSLAKGQRIAHRDSKGGDGYFTLIDWLTSDDNLDFSTSGKICDSSFDDAQWYVALSNFTLSVPATTLSPCIQNGSVATGNLYIVRVGLGIFDLSVDPLSGPADTSTGYWIFTPLQKSVSFQWGNIYTFFVASWSGSNNPPSIYL